MRKERFPILTRVLGEDEDKNVCTLEKVVQYYQRLDIPLGSIVVKKRPRGLTWR